MKKWIISVICFTLCIVLAVGAVNFVVDPLMQYRPLSPRLSFIAYDYDYINPGVAKNAEYNAVLVGTSLAENTDVDLYGEIFGCEMIKMIYPGGTSLNNKTILDVAFRTHTIDRVIWCVDDTLFFDKSDVLSHELPTYLYDENKLNDVGYLLNLSILYNYTFKDIMNTMLGQQTPPLLRGDVWSKSGNSGPEAVRKVYHPAETKAEQKEDTYYMDNVTDNLETNVRPLLEENPDTEFMFFFPPKCASYWSKALNDGLLDAKFYGIKYISEWLLQYPNVRVFFYPDREEWTNDLSIYHDNIHFDGKINSAIGQCMADGDGELTLDNYAVTLDNCLSKFREMDYSFIMES